MNTRTRRPLSLSNLRAFEAVARRLSFSEAAEELFVTQSAMSRQIKGLEDDVAPTFEAWLDGLTALGTPPTGQGSWNDVLSAVHTIVELNADQVTAAKDNDVEGFVEAKDGLQAIQSELERATASAGVATCADVHK